MDQQNNLIEQLQSDFDLTDSDITEVVATAKAQALAEAKVTLKNLILQNILSRALARPDLLVGTEVVADAAADPADDTLPLALPADLTKSEAQLRREIVALRQKLVENEQLLNEPEPEAATRSLAPNQEAYTLFDEADGYGYYIYGIIYAQNEQPVKNLPAEGIGSRMPVYAIPYRSIQAILSKVSLDEFGEAALEINLQDRDWLDMNVRAHQDIIGHVVANYPLISMRFCTICPTEKDVMDLLVRYYDDFAENLTKLEGKQEWGVKIFGVEERLKQVVPDVSPKVKALSANLNGKADGATYFIKKKIDHLLKEEAEQIGRNYAMQSHGELLNYAETAVDLPISTLQLVDGQPMLFNGAYLVPEKRAGDFQAELERLTNEYGAKGIKFELTGPWPPYNFVELDRAVNQRLAESVDGA